MKKTPLFIGIISITLSYIPFICIIAVILGTVGLVLALKAKKRDESRHWVGGLITSIIGLSIGLIFSFLSIGMLVVDYMNKPIMNTTYERPEDIIAAPPPPPLSVYELPAFSKTTADEEPHFLKVHLSLAYKQNPELSKELVDRKDEISHVINVLLQGKRYEDLDSVDDTIAVVDEIKTHVNKRLKEGKIEDIYIKEFVVN
ncbi:MAG: flagellar basal body-associated FliL family protein [bacterium]|nr:flagellar basal body-associated FliL family protein [bacterium]